LPFLRLLFNFLSFSLYSFLLLVPQPFRPCTIYLLKFLLSSISLQLSILIHLLLLFFLSVLFQYRWTWSSAAFALYCSLDQASLHCSVGLHMCYSGLVSTGCWIYFSVRAWTAVCSRVFSVYSPHTFQSSSVSCKCCSIWNFLFVITMCNIY